ncbi:hypothetical protein NLU13_5998 [Sarocladium strictum]|uniref:Zn(2)-C6 fungal-type domain-containing protein n=1 Tax=Sarocladium strictum TaxID=5046 RepID=A0AA39L6B8_SARSR|nr:hypothetical protein NLU13_5998 [Sarocladium strictum]
MDDAPSTDAGSAKRSGSGRRHTITHPAALTYTPPRSSASARNPFSCPAAAHSGRQRCASARIPTIQISAEDNRPVLFQNAENNDDDISGHAYNNMDIDQAAGPHDSIATQPGMSPMLDAASSSRPESGLGLFNLFGTAPQQQQQDTAPSSPLMQSNTAIIGQTVQNQVQPDWLSVLPFSDQYPLHSPVPSPVMSPSLPSSTFDSPLFPHHPLSSPSFSQFHYPNYTATVPGSPNAPSFIQSPSMESGASPKFGLTVKTQELGQLFSFGNPDEFAYSESTPGSDFPSKSPLDYTSSSQATSPVPSSSDSGFPGTPFLNPHLGEAIIDDGSQFPTFASQQEQLGHYQQEPGEDTTPTSLSDLRDLLQVPGHGNPKKQPRRDSDPFPKRRPHALDENSRVSRPGSQRSCSSSRARGRPISTGRQFLQDFLNSSGGGTLQERSTSPAPGPACKGKRQGPMSQEARTKATERRTQKDTCVGCKVSRTKCDPSPDIWGACTKCKNGQPKSTGAQLCGSHSFNHKTQALTLDYTSIYWITPPRTSHPSPSRLFIPMPKTLSIHDLRNNFSYLIRNSYPSIRVSSHSNNNSNNNTTLYDISLAGSLSYLSSERNSSLSTFKNWPALINTLSASPSDGWLSCLTPPYRRRTEHQILSVLPSWTAQQGYFTYSLVSAAAAAAGSSSADGSSDVVCQLDPDDPLQRRLLVSAAQVSRIIARKVERIGFDCLQGILPGADPKSKPSASNLPDPFHVRVLGRLALQLRFQCHLWDAPGSPRQSTPIALSAHDDCVDAVRWVCRSLYVFHCWLYRILRPVDLAGGPSIECSISRYPGAGRAVSELMSKGENDHGFLDWWAEGEVKVDAAEMDPVVFETDTEMVDAVMMTSNVLYS